MEKLYYTAKEVAHLKKLKNGEKKTDIHGMNAEIVRQCKKCLERFIIIWIILVEFQNIKRVRTQKEEKHNERENCRFCFWRNGI